jgi:hypothetical protein
MGNAWFRFYSEWDSDPKVQMMPEVMQRRLAMLFCWRCRGETFHETRASFHWRVTSKDMAETKELFLAQGFIDEHWNLVNWNRRQFISDNSTERVRRYRQALKQNETLHETVAPVTETAPDTDTDTEQTQNRAERPPARRAKKPPSAPASATQNEPGVFELPLADKSVYEVPAELFREYVGAYPGVTVMAEFAKMRSWLISNRARMKTRRGMAAFMNSWLNREQNRHGGKSNGKPNTESILDVVQRERAQTQANRMGGGVASREPGEAGKPTADGGVDEVADEFQW